MDSKNLQSIFGTQEGVIDKPLRQQHLRFQVQSVEKKNEREWNQLFQAVANGRVKTMGDNATFHRELVY